MVGQMELSSSPPGGRRSPYFLFQRPSAGLSQRWQQRAVAGACSASRVSPLLEEEGQRSRPMQKTAGNPSSGRGKTPSPLPEVLWIEPLSSCNRGREGAPLAYSQGPGQARFPHPHGWVGRCDRLPPRVQEGEVSCTHPSVW